MTSAVTASALQPAPESIAETAAATASELNERYRGADTPSLLAAVIRHEFPGDIALVSSFGAEAAVLLHMVADIDRATPVIFLDTGKLFGETLRYRDTLADLLGLTDVRTVAPDPARIDSVDPDGVLWYGNPNMCCYLRKVEPLNRALNGFSSWISGRKGFHGGERVNLPTIEATEDGRVKINPLAGWGQADVEAYFDRHGLPRHPLQADGFLSIGCMPCTDRVAPGEDPRAGPWRGRNKSECGIHLPVKGWRMMGID